MTADDRRVQRRYRKVAMALHPDRFALEKDDSSQLAEGLLARLVNPMYERLGQEKGRKETLALMRVKVRRLTDRGPLDLKTDLARKLLQHPASEVDVFYEQGVTQLSESQYQPLSQAQFELVTQQLGELNLVYLQLKMGDAAPVREQRTGLVPSAEPKPTQFTPAPTNPAIPTESYAERHYRRAHTYMKQGNFTAAERELRDAIKIDPAQSSYHALLGAAYYYLNRHAMARVYLRQALKLNPTEAIAVRFAKKLGADVAPSSSTPQNGKRPTASPQARRSGNKPAPQPQTTKPAGKDSMPTATRSSLLQRLLNFFRSLFRISRPSRH